MRSVLEPRALPGGGLFMDLNYAPEDIAFPKQVRPWLA